MHNERGEALAALTLHFNPALLLSTVPPRQESPGPAGILDSTGPPDNNQFRRGQDYRDRATQFVLRLQGLSPVSSARVFDTKQDLFRPITHAQVSLVESS